MENKSYFGFIRKGLNKTTSLLKTGFVSLFSSDRKKSFEEELELLERVFIEADLGVDFSLFLIEKIKDQVSYKSSDEIREFIKKELLNQFLTVARTIPVGQKPKIILFIGINGSGKTTSIAKLAANLKADGKKVLLAAGDTFRAAAVDQLTIWADRLGIEIVKHKMGADPGAVAHDACEAANARGVDYLLIDTAGRIHNQSALMEELKKVVRVIKNKTGNGSLEILQVLDGNSGQNSFIQAKTFKEAVGLDGLIITKLDGTAKGGIVVTVEKELHVPVKFIGVGEGVEDFIPFSPKQFVEALMEK